MDDPKRRPRSRRTLVWLPLALHMMLPGCILDKDDRCNPNQHYDALSVCVCDDGYKLNEAGDCEEEVVEAPTAGLGDACSDAADCVAPNDFCAPDGYCTASGCTAPGDCDTGWYCADADGTRYCHEPPTGLGASCEDAADCEGMEASFCESFVSHVCLLLGCTAEMPCPSGYACCDLTPTGFFNGTQCHLGDSCMIGEIVQ